MVPNWNVEENCTFCRISSGALTTPRVFEDQGSLAFLDHRPLFPGHCLLIPRQHFETLDDFPASRLGDFFFNVQLLSQAVQSAMDAEGSFIAMNNRVSQSVPHLHVHIVPRRRKDGLKGFFWPRTKYSSEEEMLSVNERICIAVEAIRKEISKHKK